MSSIYIFFGRFQRLSLYRLDQYTLPNAKKITIISEEINRKIAQMIHNKQRNGNITLTSVAKVAVFLFSALVLTFGVAIYLFMSILQKAFFNTLIGWKSLKLGSLSLMFAKFVTVVGQIGVALQIPSKFIEIFIFPFSFLYQAADFADLDFLYQLFSVVCQGAKAPIELFIDSFVLGVAVLFIRSNYSILWSLTLQEMNTAMAVKHWIEGKEVFSKSFFLAATALLLTATNPFVAILRFFLSFVNFGVFFADKSVAHFISPACVDIKGFENQELWLVDATTVLVWWLIAPMIYMTSEIICPKGGYTKTKTFMPFLNIKIVSSVITPAPTLEPIEENKDEYSSGSDSIDHSEEYSTISPYSQFEGDYLDDDDLESSVDCLEDGSTCSPLSPEFDFDSDSFNDMDDDSTIITSSRVENRLHSDANMFSQPSAVAFNYRNIILESPLTVESICLTTKGFFRYVWNHGV